MPRLLGSCETTEEVMEVSHHREECNVRADWGKAQRTGEQSFQQFL